MSQSQCGWIILSDQLPVVALVGRYPTNKLIGREPIPKPESISSPDHATPVRASGISTGFPVLSRVSGQVAHVLLTRSPLSHPGKPGLSFDLHVLGTPPAFVLSQDQTLRCRRFSIVFDQTRPAKQICRAASLLRDGLPRLFSSRFDFDKSL